jgi:hypothetical protein
VSVLADKPIPYGALVGGGLGHPESGDDALRTHCERHLEPMDQLGLRSAPSEGCLPAEESLARSPHPHDGRDESGIQHVVDSLGLGEFSGEGQLQSAQLGREGADAPIELALGAQGGEVRRR